MCCSSSGCKKSDTTEWLNWLRIYIVQQVLSNISPKWFYQLTLPTIYVSPSCSRIVNIFNYSYSGRYYTYFFIFQIIVIIFTIYWLDRTTRNNSRKLVLLSPFYRWGSEWFRSWTKWQGWCIVETEYKCRTTWHQSPCGPDTSCCFSSAI